MKITLIATGFDERNKVRSIGSSGGRGSGGFNQPFSGFGAGFGNLPPARTPQRRGPGVPLRWGCVCFGRLVLEPQPAQAEQRPAGPGTGRDEYDFPPFIRRLRDK